MWQGGDASLGPFCFVSAEVLFVFVIAKLCSPRRN